MSRVTSHVSRVQRYPSHGPAGTRFRLDTGHVAACQWGLLRLTTFQIPFTRGKFLHKCTQRPAHEWGQIAGGGGVKMRYTWTDFVIIQASTFLCLRKKKAFRCL